MKYLPLRIWLMAALTFALGAAITRLIWEGIVNPSAGTLTLISLVILVILGGYALFIYLTTKPSREKLKSLPVVIGVTVIATVALIGTVFHFTRFIPSPEAAAPLSKVIATLLLLAAVSSYFLILWGFWSIRKARES